MSSPPLPIGRDFVPPPAGILPVWCLPGGTLDPEGMPLSATIYICYICLPPLKAPGAATITGKLRRINIGIRINCKSN